MSEQMRQRDNLAAAANNPPSAAEIRRDPFAYLSYEHVIEERLCDLLEAIADALPDSVSPVCAKTAVDYLQTRFPGHIALENEIVFPALKAAQSDILSLGRATKQALQEHAADEDTAAELAEALTAFTNDREAGDANVLGYMLRGFFEQRRRHIVWEETLLYPLARSNIEVEDMNGLGESILHYLMQSNRIVRVSG
jgi:hemerythrin-like domain-containing protein